jgi:hypothetical protein
MLYRAARWFGSTMGFLGCIILANFFLAWISPIRQYGNRTGWGGADIALVIVYIITIWHVSPISWGWIVLGGVLGEMLFAIWNYSFSLTQSLVLILPAMLVALGLLTVKGRPFNRTDTAGGWALILAVVVVELLWVAKPWFSWGIVFGWIVGSVATMFIYRAVRGRARV